MPRRVVQRLHQQRAVRRQRGHLFLPTRRADVLGVRLGFLHVETAKRLHKQVKLFIFAGRY